MDYLRHKFLLFFLVDFIQDVFDFFVEILKFLVEL